MVDSIADALHEVAPSECMDAPFDIHHNYAAIENHFGSNVMVHRKGAVRARAGEQGIIPGSQGSASYVVTGLGNPESFMSSSHGAGRKLGRKAAQRELSLEEEQKRLDTMGVVHAVRTVKDLDEAPGSYKDIDTVMAQQTDLVEITLKLRPLAVIKG
jgi:tRNA-splicing ligase RtcB